jgi:ribose 5-phosphate isomerase B
MTLKICIGADHGGFEIKQVIHNWLVSKSITVKDYGVNSGESVDYPVYAHLVSKSIQKGEYEFGILVCGSGQGMAITANKYDKVRAALCWDKEISALARQHNNANVLVLSGRFITDAQAIEITEAFLASCFEGGRHQKRVSMIVQNLEGAKTVLLDGLSLRNRRVKRHKQLTINSKLIRRKSSMN